MQPSFSDPNIPTLTDIIEPGNEDMLNHFDASYFDEAEQAGEALIDATEQEDAIETPVIAADNLTDVLDDIIEAVLDETLPVFRQELKQQLTATILQKLEEKTQ